MAGPGIQGRRDQLVMEIQNLNVRMNSLETSYRPLFERNPQSLQPGQFYSVANKVVSAKNMAGGNATAGLSLRSDQIATVVRAAFSEFYRAQSLAKTLTYESNAEQFVRNEPRIRSLLQNNTRLIRFLEETIDSARPVESAASSFSRVIGLSGLDGDPATIAIVVAVVVVVLIVAIYALVRHIYDAQQLTASVEAACAADARTGHPCTGDQLVAYRNEVSRQNQQYGNPDPIANLFGQVGSGINALFWIGGISLVAYMAFVTFPAAAATRRLIKEKSDRLLPSG